MAHQGRGQAKRRGGRPSSNLDQVEVARCAVLASIQTSVKSLDQSFVAQSVQLPLRDTDPASVGVGEDRGQLGKFRAHGHTQECGNKRSQIWAYWQQLGPTQDSLDTDASRRCGQRPPPQVIQEGSSSRFCGTTHSALDLLSRQVGYATRGAGLRVIDGGQGEAPGSRTPTCEKGRATMRSANRSCRNWVTVSAILGFLLLAQASVAVAQGPSAPSVQTSRRDLLPVVERYLDALVTDATKTLLRVPARSIVYPPPDRSNVPICVDASRSPVAVYPLSDAHRDYEQIRKDFVQSLRQDPELEPLLSYVLETYPRPQFEVQAGECTGYLEVTTGPSMRANRDRVLAFATRVRGALKRRGVVMTITVKSDPSGANVSPAAVPWQHSAEENDHQRRSAKRLSRPPSLRDSEEGYSPAEGILNLIDEAGPVLSCPLRPLGEAAVACRFGER